MLSSVVNIDQVIDEEDLYVSSNGLLLKVHSLRFDRSEGTGVERWCRRIPDWDTSILAGLQTVAAYQPDVLRFYGCS